MVDSVESTSQVEISLQSRLDKMLSQIGTVQLPKEGLQLPSIKRRYILEPEHEWPYKDFRQAASDLEFRQGKKAVYLKKYFPGDYWIYEQTYTRANIDEGDKPTGSSQGKFIYIPGFPQDFDPTPLEVGEFNIIGVHEAAHRVDDHNNAALYGGLQSALSKEESSSLEYIQLLKELKTRSELGAWELVLSALEQMCRDGVSIFPGTHKQLRKIILRALRSQQSFFTVRLPQD